MERSLESLFLDDELSLYDFISISQLYSGGGGGGGGGTGQVIITTTGVGATGPNLVAINGVVVTAHPLNSPLTSTIGGTVGIGPVSNSVGGSGPGAFLQPGASLGLAVSNVKYLYVNGIAGDKFYFSVN